MRDLSHKNSCLSQFVITSAEYCLREMGAGRSAIVKVRTSP